jgi:hypothetical protein
VIAASSYSTLQHDLDVNTQTQPGLTGRAAAYAGKTLTPPQLTAADVGWNTPFHTGDGGPMP